MKRLFALLLALALMFSLCSCGKTPTLNDMIEYPLGKSQQECEKYLKSCGCKIEMVTEQGIAFEYGLWSGTASSMGITLNLNMSQFGISKEEVAAAQEAMASEIKAICGEPYSANSSKMPPISNEFYSCGDRVVTITRTSGFGDSMTVTILRAPN